MIIIKNGIITSDKLNIIQHLIPTSNKEAYGYPMTPIYITIHNTGNPNVSAKNNSIYVDKNNGYVSWHFTIDDKEIYQELPVTVSGWHSGDGANGTGNRKSIGIEIAEVDGAEKMAIKFVAELLIALNMNIDKVVPHKHWSGKNCPRLILPHWDDFIKDIEKEMNKIILTVDEAKKLLKANANLDDNTIQYLEYYRYGEDLIKKLANGMVKENTNIIEKPIDKEIGFSQTVNGTFELWANPEQLSVKVVNQHNNTIKEPYAINGSFFWYSDDARKNTYSTSILIQNGVILQNTANHYYNFGCPQNVFIVYKNGKVEMKKVYFATELDYKNIVVGIGGLGLKDITNPNFKYDPASEGFKKDINKITGKTEDQSGVTRLTNKTVIGYNIKQNKVYLMVRKNIYHSHPLYYDLLELVNDCEYDICLACDGGGSTIFNNGTDMLVKGDNRLINNILLFTK